MGLFVGLESFIGGETLKKRVRPGEPRQLAYCGGWNIREGSAIPQKLPTLLSTTALGGTIPAQVPFAFRDETGERIICRDANEYVRMMGVDGKWDPAGDWFPSLPEVGTMNATTETFTLTGHGLVNGDTLESRLGLYGLQTNKTYYVINAADDTFQLSTVAGGSAINITQTRQFNNLFSLYKGPNIPVISDSPPFRVGPLVVFPTIEGMIAYEPDSPSTRSRLLSFKGPRDYEDGTKPVWRSNSSTWP